MTRFLFSSVMAAGAAGFSFRSLPLVLGLLLFSVNGAAGEARGADAGEEAVPPPAVRQKGFTAVLMDAHRPEVERITADRERVLSRHDPESVFGKNSESFSPPLRTQWGNICKDFASLAPAKQLRYINGFFNGWMSHKDEVSYNVEDYWAAPDEFLAAGGGDCEDYAIIKYLALRYLGWPPERLWIVAVTNLNTGSKHAVLVADTGSRCFVLDNLSRPVYLLIPLEDYFKQYAPIFAVNEDAIWAYVQENGPPAVPDEGGS